MQVLRAIDRDEGGNDSAVHFNIPPDSNVALNFSIRESGGLQSFHNLFLSHPALCISVSLDPLVCVCNCIVWLLCALLLCFPHCLLLLFCHIYLLPLFSQHTQTKCALAFMLHLDSLVCTNVIRAAMELNCTRLSSIKLKFHRAQFDLKAPLFCVSPFLCYYSRFLGPTASLVLASPLQTLSRSTSSSLTLYVPLVLRDGGLRFDQHGDSHGVRMSLSEGRSPGRREREAKWGRVGQRDSLFAPALLFARPWTQHCCPAGHFSLCGHSFG